MTSLYSRLQAPLDRDAFRILAFLMIALGGIAYLLSPIIVGDTDMWYHLNGGRYFWENWQVPRTAYFSFINTDREWINYFWGFQALIYKIYEYTGYYGLVVLRTLLLIGISLLVYLHIARRMTRESSVAFALVVLALSLILLEGRAYQVRPHLFSYFFILLFIYILEYKPQKAFYLPLLTVLWVNLHGVEYVIGTLVVGAYFIDTLYQRVIRKYVDPQRDNRYLFLLALCAVALLVNPYGYRIIFSAFSFPVLLDTFIGELKPADFSSYVALQYVDLSLHYRQAFVVLFFIGIYLLFNKIKYRTLSVRHVLLLAGGLFLLMQGQRFKWEWLLLSMPILSEPVSSLLGKNQHSYLLRNTAVVLFVFTVYWQSIATAFNDKHGYPYSPDGLPAGVASYLEQYGDGGNLLSRPSVNGFLAWRLYPDYLVSTDMQFPPSDIVTYYRVSAAFAAEAAMRNLLDSHTIDYAGAYLGDEDFKTLIRKFPEFRLVFFDEKMTLFVNTRLHPGKGNEALHRAYVTGEADDANGREETARALREMLALVPENSTAQLFLIKNLFRSARFGESAIESRELLTYRPYSAEAYFWLGRSLESLERCDEAIEYFIAGRAYADESMIPTFDTHIGACHFELHDFAAAYNAFSATLKAAQKIETLINMYQLAVSAAYVGRDDEAKAYLEMILVRADESDSENALIFEETRKLLTRIENGEIAGDTSPANWFRQLFN